MSKRGIFVYDWTDIHRTDSEAVHAYELVATPATPIKINVLPSNLVAIATSLQLSDVIFSEGKLLDIRAYVSCCE